MRNFQEEDAFLSRLPDGLLIQRTLEGNERAFEVLVGRYSSDLLRYITAGLGDYDTACDVLQQVLLQLYFGLPSLKQDTSLKPWLWQVTRRKLIDELRHKHWVSLSHPDQTEGETVLSMLADPTVLPEEQFAHQELQQAVKKAITTLPKRYQPVVILRYLTQLPFSQISRLLDIPQATAKTHFQRARPFLRAALQAEQESLWQNTPGRFHDFPTK